MAVRGNGNMDDERLFEDIEVDGVHIRIAHSPSYGKAGYAGSLRKRPGLSEGRVNYLYCLAVKAAADANGWPIPANAREAAEREAAEPTVKQPARVVPFKYDPKSW